MSNARVLFFNIMALGGQVSARRGGGGRGGVGFESATSTAVIARAAGCRLAIGNVTKPSGRMG